MFCHLMHLYANFQMGHLGTFEFNLQTFPSELPTSPQIWPLEPTTLKTSQCTLPLFQNSPHICSNSAFKKNPKQPILHIRIFPICALKNLASKPKKLAPNHPKFCPNFAKFKMPWKLMQSIKEEIFKFETYWFFWFHHIQS